MWLLISAQWLSLIFATKVRLAHFEFPEMVNGNKILGSVNMDGYGDYDRENYHFVSALINQHAAIGGPTEELYSDFACKFSSAPLQTYDRLIFLDRFLEHEKRRKTNEGNQARNQAVFDNAVLTLFDEKWREGAWKRSHAKSHHRYRQRLDL